MPHRMRVLCHARWAPVAGLVIAVSGCGISARGGVHNPDRRASVLAAYGRLPLRFERNLGQSDPRVRFIARGTRSTLFLTSFEAVLAMSAARTSREEVVRMQFAGADHPSVEGARRLPGTVNSFLGRSRSRWHTRIPTFARVRYRHLWPGIGASFYGNGTRFDYDFEIAAGADPSQIALRFVGAQRQQLNARGDLVLTLPGGRSVRVLAPVAYQLVGRSRDAVASRFMRSGRVIRLALGSYDHRRPLTVDPALVYATYLGGTGEDVGNAVAVDASDQAYVTGLTFSTDFPTSGPEQPANGGGQDVFVAKLNASGSSLSYCTYLGGSGDDDGHGIAVDSAGNAYVAGSTTSTNFPTRNPLQPASGGGEDAFVAKLSADGGSLVYSTYLGGSSNDLANAIAIDPTGEAYLSGPTVSTNFPTQNPLQPASAGGGDDFVAKLNAAGNALVYSTYLGGSGADQGNAIAVDGAGEAYLTGSTSSTNFPTQNPLQPTSGGGADDAFVAKLNAAGSALVYSSYLGGGGDDAGFGIAVDPLGDAYLTGSTTSTNFLTRGAQQPSCGDLGCSQGDAFVTEIASTGAGVVYSTYLGGGGADQGNAIAVDAAGEAYVTGSTLSAEFPTRNPEQLIPGGSGDAFVTKLAAGGAALIYSTYLGGSGRDIGFGVALGTAGDAFATGWTSSTNFPTRGAVQPSCGDSVLCGQGDTFVTRLPSDVTPPSSTNTIPSCRGGVIVTVTDDAGGSGPGSVHFRLDGGAEQVIPTTGIPGIAEIPIPEGNHTLEDWGQDASGNMEFPHHVANIQIDTTPPSLSITSDQRFLAYEAGDRASVTIAASDATSGLRTNPSASHVAISTAKPGHYTIARSASDRCGNSASASFSYTVIPYPVLAVTVDVAVASGTVRVRKGGRFVALTEPRPISVGSTIDTTRGTIRLTTATSKRGRYQSGKFQGGVFQVLQRRSQRGLAELRLIDKGSAICRRSRKGQLTSSLSRAILRLLHSDAHGRFRTRGRWSAATVRGTKWTTEDRCDGTLTIVSRGTVIVRDFRLAPHRQGARWSPLSGAGSVGRCDRNPGIRDGATSFCSRRSPRSRVAPALIKLASAAGAATGPLLGLPMVSCR